MELACEELCIKLFLYYVLMCLRGILNIVAVVDLQADGMWAVLAKELVEI